MLVAATLQVKNIDPELHAALATRARHEGRTLSDLVVSMLRRELARPSIDDWIATVRRGPHLDHDVDAVTALDEERGAWPDAGGR